jgi:adenosylcobinamide-GDP ribazoletransferase
MKKLAAAFTLLTIIPIPRVSPGEQDIAGCKPYFPVVGLVIGTLACITTILMCKIPQSITSVIVVIFLALISRCFHLDGLADSADGIMSSRPREKMLEIMRDSHIGTMGVFAILAVFSVKTVSFISISSSALPAVVLLAPILSRYSIILYTHVSQYARENGLGKAMFENKSFLTLLWGTLFSTSFAYYFLAITGILIFCGIIVSTLLWAFYTRIKLGGATGDTIGANVEISEMLVPLLFVLITN